jgi:hypothetical protein
LVVLMQIEHGLIELGDVVPGVIGVHQRLEFRADLGGGGGAKCALRPEQSAEITQGRVTLGGCADAQPERLGFGQLHGITI